MSAKVDRAALHNGIVSQVIQQSKTSKADYHFPDFRLISLGHPCKRVKLRGVSTWCQHVMIEGPIPENLKAHKGRKELRCSAVIPVGLCVSIQKVEFCLISNSLQLGRYATTLVSLRISTVKSFISFFASIRISRPLASPRVIYNHALVRPAFYRH